MPRILRIERNVLKLLGGFLIGVVVFCAVCMAALLLWVKTGPRSIDSLTPYIESSLSSPADGFKVKIESSEISWESIHNPLGISIKNVEVINANNAVVAYFPQIVMNIYLRRLLLGQFDVHSLEVLYPNITLIQNDDGSISTGMDERQVAPQTLLPGQPQPEKAEPAPVAPLIPLLMSEESNNPLRHLKSLIIRHANCVIKNRMTGILLRSSEASLEIYRKHGVLSGALEIPLAFSDRKGEIFSNFTVQKHDDKASARLVYKSIPTSVLYGLFPSQQWLSGVNVLLSGSVDVASDLKGDIQKLDFGLESGPGSIKYPEALPNPINLKSLKIFGSTAGKLDGVTITNGQLELIGSDSKPISLSFNGSAQKVGGDYALDMHAQTANVAVNEVKHVWPTILSPHSRSWVTTRIMNGTITKASVDLHFKPGDMKLKDTPQEDIAATIAVRGADVKYLPNHPAVTDVSAVIAFTGKSMDVKVASAKFLTGSIISAGHISMPDMYPDDVKMFMELNADAPATDVAAFLALPQVEKADKLHITNAVTGHATGTAKLDFIAFSEQNREGEDMHYAIDAKLGGVSQPKFLGKQDVENANVDLALDNKGVKVQGAATINKVPMHLDLYSSFAEGNETKYSIQCDMPVDKLATFGLSGIDFATGSIGVNAQFTESSKTDTSKAKLDLTRTDIALAEHGFYKKAGVPETLDVETQALPSGNTQIKSFMLQGSDVKVSGSGELDRKTGGFNSLIFTKVLFGENDLTHLDYRKTNSGVTVTANGNVLDVSPYVNGNGSSNLGFNLNIKAGKVIFGDKRTLTSANIQADCPTICKSADVTGTLPDNASFTYAIRDGKLNAATDNAGELFRVIGISDSIQGGKMQLSGVYHGDNLEGALVMSDYTLKNAPLLTKILTIASLTGVIDTLTGKGIVFNKLLAPYTYRSGIIVLKGAKTHGNALGLTADGTIDKNNSTLDLSGLIIPSYTMNTIIGNVPLIGDMLMGGEGKGIIGMNYHMKGKTGDPSVTVNPLSALTPGFLRGIFNVFDKPAPDIDKIVADHKKAEDAEQKKAEPAPVPIPAPAKPPEK
ncbi:MAG TPA: AsmA-like C-terminal domain-containing protein [Rickettsiales bacterium]|nr:AsmA-like C-terminal domain-containing protein [Rickettsiales bacterium]